MNEYDDRWMQTHTGKKFHWHNPAPEEICIEDIAHHLSLICRFGGACNMFYSVAEHSVRVSELVDDSLKIHALLHDAPEAYIGDIVRPIKHAFGLTYEESLIERAIAQKFKLSKISTLSLSIIKMVDSTMLATERRDLMGYEENEWESLPEPLPKKIRPLEPLEARRWFLETFFKYFEG